MDGFEPRRVHVPRRTADQAAAGKGERLARVLERVKQWRDAEHPTTKSRFTAERSKLATAVAEGIADHFSR